jgi:hypothetical protein
MAKVKVYMGAFIKDPLGVPSEFKVSVSGTIYDTHNGQWHRVGSVDRKGIVRVEMNFVDRYPIRARILGELLEEPKQEKANDG